MRKAMMENPGIIPVALGFLCYCLCTDADSVADNLVAASLPTLLPPPYDFFSLGMLAVLGAGATLPRACALLFDTRVLAIGVTLMATGPLYATFIGAGPGIYALAVLGGVGKAVVLLHVGAALASLGPSRAFAAVAAMGAASSLAGPLLSLHPAVFAVVSLAAAPACGLCLYLNIVRGGGASPAVPAPELLAPRDFARAVGAVAMLGLGAVLCSEPVELALGGASSEAHLALLTLAAAAAGALLLLAGPGSLPRRWERAAIGAVLSLVIGACGFLAFDGCASFWMCLALAGQWLFQTLFFAAVPFACWPASGAARDCADGEGARRFAVAALGYCGALSLAIFGSRMAAPALQGAPMAFAGVALVLAAAVLGLSVWRGGRGRGRTYGELWEAGVEAVAGRGGLSPRETEVLSLAARGYDSRAIQEALVISPSTVSTHLQSVYKKLDLHSRQEIIRAIEEALAAQDR